MIPEDKKIYGAMYNRAGECCLCGAHIDFYDSKYTNEETGQIACDDHIDDESKWHRVYNPINPQLAGFKYWTDG